jgi:hypothetical protein
MLNFLTDASEHVISVYIKVIDDSVAFIPIIVHYFVKRHGLGSHNLMLFTHRCDYKCLHVMFIYIKK